MLLRALLVGLLLVGQSARALELNMWVMSGSESLQQDMQVLLKPFLDKNPGLRLNVTVLDWSTAWGKINAAAVSGQGPDILELGTTWVASLAAMGALQHIDDVQLKDVGGAKAFFPALWNTTHPYNDPKIYAVPWYGDARVAFYRTDVFEAAGVSPADAFANWGNFKKAMRTINGTVVGGRKIAALGYPGKDDLNIFHNLAPWIWNAGGDVLTSDNRRAAINSSESVQAITYYTSLAVEGLVPKAALKKNSDAIDAGYLNGDYAVIFTGPWLLKPMRTSKAKGGQMESIAAQKTAVAPYPAGPQGSYTFFSGSNLAIMTSSKSKDVAWQVLAFLTQREAQIKHSQQTAMLPARMDAAFDPVLMADKNYQSFVSVIHNGRHYPSMPGWGTLEEVFLMDFAQMYAAIASASAENSPQLIKQQLDTTARNANKVLTRLR
jgi:multiple sugar transport system substrate-binding protein